MGVMEFLFGPGNKSAAEPTQGESKVEVNFRLPDGRKFTFPQGGESWFGTVVNELKAMGLDESAQQVVLNAVTGNIGENGAIITSEDLQQDIRAAKIRGIRQQLQPVFPKRNETAAGKFWRDFSSSFWRR